MRSMSDSLDLCLHRYSGLSYEQIMLLPLAQALAEVAKEDSRLKRVYFSLQVS